MSWACCGVPVKRWCEADVDSEKHCFLPSSCHFLPENPGGMLTVGARGPASWTYTCVIYIRLWKRVYEPWLSERLLGENNSRCAYSNDFDSKNLPFLELVRACGLCSLSTCFVDGILIMSSDCCQLLLLAYLCPESLKKPKFLKDFKVSWSSFSWLVYLQV